MTMTEKDDSALAIGHYWVRTKYSEPPDGVWTVARWEFGFWWVTCEEDGYETEFWEEIGPRIEAPKEPASLTKIEEVARAIDPDIWAIDGPIPTRADTIDFHARRQASIDCARIAVDAMRIPTEAMTFAGHGPLESSVGTSNGELYFDAEGPFHTWNAMIDAALQESP